MRIHPFSGLLVRPELASRTVCPAFDVLRPEERQSLSDIEPLSYLHVIAAEEDEPVGPQGDTQLERSAQALRRMVGDGVFAPVGGPAAVAYRVRSGARSHTGILAEVAVEEHHAGRVKPHEQIRPAKAARFADHLRTVGATSTPALLVYRDGSDLESMVEDLEGRAPHCDVTAADGKQHTLWVERDRETVDALTKRLEQISTLYVADGHHRVEAVAQVAAEGGGPGHLLALLVPPSEVDLLPYHRVVKDVDGGRVRQALLERFDVDDLGPVRPDAARPRQRGEVGMWVAGTWFRIRLPQADLDSVALQEAILGPLLGVADPKTDDRLEFVPDETGLERIARLTGRDDVAVVLLHPPSVEEVMAVADAGGTMPPKSTWFEPKLPSGLVLHAIRPLTGPR
jgi:uncharacterized protein (DUF1015 family)